jgi:membrane protease YdiL (CAAX protease family)
MKIRMDSQNTNDLVINQRAKKFGVYAIGVMAIQGLIFGFLFCVKLNPKMIFYTAGFFMWFMPLLMAFVIEKQNAASLGWVIRRDKVFVYSLYTILGLLLLLLVSGLSFYLRTIITGESSGEVIGTTRGIFSALFIQLSLVGFPEELYFRGYLTNRLCDWLGNRGGILIIASIFGLGHIIHRLSLHGTQFLIPAIIIGTQAFIGGVVLGYQLRKTKSLLPPAITHLALNIFPVFI